MIGHTLEKKYFLLILILLGFFPLNYFFFHLVGIECFKLILLVVLSLLFGHLCFFIHTALPKECKIGTFYGVIYLFFFSLWGHLNYIFVTLSLIPYSSCFLIVPLILFGGFIFINKKDTFWSNYKQSENHQFIDDLLFFLISFILFLCQSSFHSQIYWGEKPMDLSFISSFLKTNVLPITDPWFSGEIPHYYIMGYYLLSLFPKMVSLDASTSYHFCFAFLYAFNLWIIKDFLGLFVRAKKKRMGIYWIFSFFVLMIPNVKSFILFFSKIFQGQMALTFTEFWSLTRIYDNTLFTEFPSWSYLFADLHAHVMSYLFSALALFSFFFYFKKYRSLSLEPRKHIISLFACSFSLGLVGIINIWDYVLLSGVFAFLILYNLFKVPGKKNIFAILVYPLSLIIFLPQWFYQFGGIPLSFGIRDGQVESISQMFLQFGALFTLILIFLFFRLVNKNKFKNFSDYRLSVSILFLIIILLVLCRKFYLMDQMNTVFKFQTSSYYFMSLMIAVLYLPLLQKKIHKKLKYFIVLVFLILNLTNLSPLLTLLKTWYLPEDWRIRTIEGKRFLAVSNHELYQLINYFNQYIDGRPNIMEHYGESFQHEKNMLSTYTGSSSFVGWMGHVRIRGANFRTILLRRDIVDQIYESPDALSSYNLAKQNNIDFIVTTRSEKDAYGSRVDLKFKTFSDIFPRIICFGDTCLFGIKGNYEKYLGR